MERVVKRVVLAIIVAVIAVCMFSKSSFAAVDLKDPSLTEIPSTTTKANTTNTNTNTTNATTNTVKSESESKKAMPQTGSNSWVFYVSGVAVLGIAAICLYKKQNNIVIK